MGSLFVVKTETFLFELKNNAAAVLMKLRWPMVLLDNDPFRNYKNDKKAASFLQHRHSSRGERTFI